MNYSYANFLKIQASFPPRFQFEMWCGLKSTEVRAPPCGRQGRSEREPDRPNAPSRARRRVPSMLAEQPADEPQVCLHVLGHIAGRRRGFELRPAGEADGYDGLDNLREVDLPLSQQVRIVLQMELANPVLAQPANL